MVMPGRPLKTANVYIDGYNFYYSISKTETLHLGWCNFLKLADRLASRAFGDRYVVGAVKYYTATVDERTENRAGEIERQKLWLDALKYGSQGKVQVVKGFYKLDEEGRRKEKKTDTNIVVGMIRDALLPAPTMTPKLDPRVPCDAIILMSGDSDFLPAVEMIRHEYDKEVAVFYPHNDPHEPFPEGRIKVHKVTIEDLERSRLNDAVRWAEYQKLKGLT